jgi:hypothetical protein
LRPVSSFEGDAPEQGSAGLEEDVADFPITVEHVVVGSLASIEKTIADGVPQPKKYGAPMPPMGGAQLSPSQLSAVAAYVWTLGHRSGK